MSAIVAGGEAYYIKRKVFPLLQEYGIDDLRHVPEERSRYPVVDFVFILVDLCSHPMVATLTKHAASIGAEVVIITRREPAIRKACEKLGLKPGAAPFRPRSDEPRVDRPLWAASMLLLGDEWNLKCARSHPYVAGRHLPFPEECPTCMKEAPMALVTPVQPPDSRKPPEPVREAIALLLHAMRECNVETVSVESDGSYSLRRVVVEEISGAMEVK